MSDVRLHSTSDGWRLQVTLGESDTEEYPCEIITCESPFCGCQDMTLAVSRPETELDQNQREASSQERHKIRLDPFAQTATPECTEGTEGTEAEKEWSELLTGLSAEDWDLLRGAFLEEKRQVIDTMESCTEDVEFDFDDVEKNGALVSYQALVPFAPRVLVTLGQTQFLVEEQHCVRAQCRCTSAVVEFLALKEGAAELTEPEYAFSVDHTKDRWGYADTSRPLRGRADKLRRALLESQPGFVDSLASRHDQLRKIYLRSMAHFGVEKAPPLTETRPKVGRNAPCPCGSGKKFKKCCGKQGLNVPDASETRERHV